MILSKGRLDGDKGGISSSVLGVIDRWLWVGDDLFLKLPPGEAGGVKVKTSGGNE
jgi:hypothetical protein